MDKREQFEAWLADWQRGTGPLSTPGKVMARACWQAARAAQAAPGEAVATLHDDGHWTWKPHMKASNEAYKSSFAGWRMDVYGRPPLDAGRAAIAEECAHSWHDYGSHAGTPLAYCDKCKMLSANGSEGIPYGSPAAQPEPSDWNAAIEAAKRVCEKQPGRDYANQIGDGQSDDYMDGYVGGCGDCEQAIGALAKEQS